MESAKKCLVKLYQPDADSVKWRFLLNFLGVEATPLQDEKALIQTLLYDPAGLVIFDAALLGEAFAALGANCFHWLE
jgi:hypothetical protein